MFNELKKLIFLFSIMFVSCKDCGELVNDKIYEEMDTIFVFAPFQIDFDVKFINNIVRNESEVKFDSARDSRDMIAFLFYHINIPLTKMLFQ